MPKRMITRRRVNNRKVKDLMRAMLPGQPNGRRMAGHFRRLEQQRQQQFDDWRYALKQEGFINKTLWPKAFFEEIARRRHNFTRTLGWLDRSSWPEPAKRRLSLRLSFNRDNRARDQRYLQRPSTKRPRYRG